MGKKRALGRGLSALLEGSDLESPTSLRQEVSQTGVNDIDIARIVPNPKQPRSQFDEDTLRQLAESIVQYGVIQPITVRKSNTGNFEIISGERRWRAAKLAGLTHIPAYIRTTKDEDLLALALIENLQREDLDALEIAHSYERMIEELHLKQEEMAKRVHKSRSSVTNYLRLLNLPAEIQLAIRKKQISMGHARVLTGIKDVPLRNFIFKKILSHGISVRQTEALANNHKKGAGKQHSPLKIASLSFEQEKHLMDIQRFVGNKVEIRKSEEGNGKITIAFGDDSDLTRILELLNP